ncbi:uncharacterized protein LOC141910755 [Tubulanus polymorphus]|uniref:uncharacterized protein LOC141910755 n=1 Tax=Tubulanus polymorphus TaxID=672921 RepID=UPI003DA4D3CF
MDCNNTTKLVLRRASLDHRHLRQKIPWKSLRRRVLINRSLIAGVGALLLVIAVAQTALSVKLVDRCRQHLHYTPCYRGGDPCSSMATPAFFGCAVMLSMFCALACASPRMLAILLFVITVSGIAMVVYQRSSPFLTGSGLFRAFIPTRVILTDLCDREAAFQRPDALMHSCWSELEASFRKCHKINYTHAILCNLTKSTPTEANFKFVRDDHHDQTHRPYSSNATTRDQLEMCFNDVSAHSKSHFIHYISITSLIGFVCAFLHLAGGGAIFFLDMKRRVIKTEIVKRQDAEGLKCPDQNHKRKISKEQQRINHHTAAAAETQLETMTSDRKISSTQSCDQLTGADSERFFEVKRKHASTGDTPVSDTSRNELRNSRSRSRESDNAQILLQQQKSPSSRRPRGGATIASAAGSNMGKKRRVNSGDVARRIGGENAGYAATDAKDRRRHASDAGPRRPPPNAQRTVSYPPRPLRTSRDMAVQISPESFFAESIDKTEDELPV